MADLKTLVEREMDRAGEPTFAFEGLESLRVRRHRTKRITAAAVGLGLVLIASLVGASIYRSASANRPAVHPTPNPPAVDLGIFEPVAGRIVYWAGGSLLAVDPNAPSPVSTLVRLDPGGTPEADRFALPTVPLGWSSDGTELLFLRVDPTKVENDTCRGRDCWSLYILHADGTETQVTSEPVEGAAISPDGSRVVYTSTDESSKWLYVVDAEGGQPVRISAFGEEPTFSVDGAPTFSPDGTQIAYLSSPDNPGCCVESWREHVWVANADGTDAHEILSDEPALAKGVFELTWSPAGDRIAMENSLGQYGGGGIYTFAPDGSQFTKVITDGINPFWSPDGSQIAYDYFNYSTRSGPSGLTIADADGSNVRSFGIGASGPWHPGTLENSAGG
jgi:hypothetical protein